MFWRKRKSDPLTSVERIQALNLKKNDIVIVTVPAGGGAERAQAVKQICDPIFLSKGASVVMVVERGFAVEFVRATPEASQPAAATG